MNPRVRAGARAIGVSMAVCLLLATSAWAQVIFNVDSIGDEIDDNTAIATCHTAVGTCTLRAAVMQANHIAIANTLINLPAGIYKLGAAVDADSDDTGDLNLTSPGGSPIVTIIGAGAATTVIDGNSTDRILSIAVGREADISGVTIRNGKANYVGGGILNAGTLKLSYSVLDHNTVSSDGVDGGGGIFNSGDLTVSNSTVDTDKAINASGGGIFNASSGTATVTRSTLVANEGDYGGGIANYGSLNLDYSTLSRNVSSVRGGGIYNGSILFAVNSTVSGNTAGSDGGGIYNDSAGPNGAVYNLTIAFNTADKDNDGNGSGGGVYNGGTFNLHSSVVAGNTHSLPTVPDDCTGAFGFDGNNRLGSAIGCSVDLNSSSGAVYLVHSLNELGALKDNGGPTQTIALVPPSNMIDAGIVDQGLACLDKSNLPLSTDQRGRPRIIGTACDIGAYEYDPGDIFANGFQ